MKKKICKLSTIVCVSLFLLGLTITAHASDTSQTLVAEGRALLINGGDPTYSGILSANAKFDAAVTEDSSDQEANLFYAVTRIVAFGLEQGSSPELETLRELFEAFGISRNNVDLVETDVPFNDPPEIYDHYDPPETIPGGEDVRAFLAGPFLTLLNAAITNLNVITDTFNITLLASEIDDDHDVEVDYGDVLVLKSALYMLKSSILIATAFDLDINLRELVVLGNAGVLQIQRDILDKYPNFISLRTADGTASLADAKQALLNGINTYSDAFNFITTESDPHENDFFYFESGQDQREAELVLTQLTELKNSLNENQATEFTTIKERWILTDVDTDYQLDVEIEKDVNEKFVCGDYWGQNGCDFISCSGWVEVFSVSGTSVTIEMAYDGMYSGSATFTGTITDGTSISGTYTEYDGSGNVVVSDKPFTATPQSQQTEAEIIDFNRIFGNTGKASLNIRSILPEFDQYDEPIPNSFNEPILNGILPDVATNDALTEELELIGGLIEISVVENNSINEDGLVDDWTSVSSSFTDQTSEESAIMAGSDIKDIYLAKDDNYLYFRIDLANGAPNKTWVENEYIRYQFNFEVEDLYNTQKQISIWWENNQWNVSTMYESHDGYVNDHSPDAYVQDNENILEGRVSLAFIGVMSGRYLRANTCSLQRTEDYDYITNRLDFAESPMIGPLFSISGNVICDAHDGSGNIYIYAFDGPNPYTAHELGNIFISTPGDYNMDFIPAGENVYLFAKWDADDNGIKTFFDYLGKTGPITVAYGGITVPEFSINTLINNDYIMTKPGTYRVFGSNTYDIPQNYYGPWDPNDVDWGDGWTFIGESNKTETFNTGQYYKNILIIWDEKPVFNFDAFEDLTAKTALATNADGTSCEYNWISSGLKNFNAYDWSEPYYFKGHPDGLYACTEDWYGFSLFTMPDDTIGNVVRQLKITLALNLLGDLNGDNDVGIADAILALRVVSNYLDVIGLNFNSDVNGNGRIGLEEAIYTLQVASGLKATQSVEY